MVYFHVTHGVQLRHLKVQSKRVHLSRLVHTCTCPDLAHVHIPISRHVSRLVPRHPKVWPNVTNHHFVPALQHICTPFKDHFLSYFWRCTLRWHMSRSSSDAKPISWHRKGILENNYFHPFSTRFDSFQWRFSMFQLPFSTCLNSSPNPYLFRFFPLQFYATWYPTLCISVSSKRHKTSLSKSIFSTSFRVVPPLHSSFLTSSYLLLHTLGFSLSCVHLPFVSKARSSFPSPRPCCDTSSYSFDLNSLWLVSSRFLLPFLTSRFAKAELSSKPFSYSFFAPILCDSVVPPSRSLRSYLPHLILRQSYLLPPLLESVVPPSLLPLCPSPLILCGSPALSQLPSLPTCSTYISTPTSTCTR